MIKSIFKRIFETMKKNPLEIIGFSAVKMIIEAIACAIPVMPVVILTFIATIMQYYVYYWVSDIVFATVAIIPVLIIIFLAIMAICVIAVLEAGMYKIYLGCISEGNGKFSDLFLGFRSLKMLLRIVGGYWWKMLFIFLWSLIPVAGVFIVIYKAYSYRFSPIILIMKPEIAVKESLEASKMMTNGKKGQMFLCDLIIAGVTLGVTFVGEIIAIIPVIGWILSIPIAVALWAVGVASQIAVSLVTACFYYVLDNGIFEEEVIFEEIKDNYFMNCDSYDNE